MSQLGDFRTGKVLRFTFTTVSTAGVPTQLAGSPAISVYKDASTTQSTTGVTLTVDFDGVTGLNHVAIDTSADGSFYAAGSDFHVVLTAGTVSGASVVGYTVGLFSLENRSSLMPTTDGRKLDVSAGGEAGVDWANVGSPTTTVTLSGTTVKTATDVETDTADIQTRIPAALVGGRIDANMGAISADATAADNLETMLDGTGGQTLSLGALTISGAFTVSGGTTFTSSTGIGFTCSATGTGTHGFFAQGQGAGHGFFVLGGGTGDGLHATGGATSGSGIKAQGDGSGVAITATGSVAFSSTFAVSGTTTLNALTVTNATTLSGAVSLGSTLGVTGTTTFAAINTGAITATTLTTSGTTTFNALTVTGALTAGSNAVPWNASWDTEVQSEVDDALVAQRLDELLNADSDIDGAQPPTVGSVFHELMTKTTGSFTFDQTTDSLEALRDRGDAAWITATGFSTLTQADVRTAVGLASANLDTQLSAIAGYIDTEVAAILAAVDTEVAAIKAKTDNLPASPAATGDAMALTASERNSVAAALLDLAAGVETNRTVRQTLRLMLAALAGKLSGAATTTITIRDTNDSVNRVVATVDSSGNRSAITLDAS